MFYGGYGGGSKYALLVIVALALARILATRSRGGARRRQRQSYGAPTSQFTGKTATWTDTAAGSSNTGGKIPAGWLTDPSGKFDQRYWSGTQWTEHVVRHGEPSIDPVPPSLVPQDEADRSGGDAADRGDGPAPGSPPLGGD